MSQNVCVNKQNVLILHRKPNKVTQKPLTSIKQKVFRLIFVRVAFQAMHI